MDKTFQWRDPFAGDLEGEGETLDEALTFAYDDIPPEERPAYVWVDGQRVDVPGGMAHPVQ